MSYSRAIALVFNGVGISIGRTGPYKFNDKRNKFNGLIIITCRIFSIYMAIVQRCSALLVRHFHFHLPTRCGSPSSCAVRPPCFSNLNRVCMLSLLFIIFLTDFFFGCSSRPLHFTISFFFVVAIRLWPDLTVFIVLGFVSSAFSANIKYDTQYIEFGSIKCIRQRMQSLLRYIHTKLPMIVQVHLTLARHFSF